MRRQIREFRWPTPSRPRWKFQNRRSFVGMQLKQLVQQLDTLKVEGSLDGEVSGIAYDSRRVTPVMLFVAIPGQRTHRHEYIQTALERRAAAVVCERHGTVPQAETGIKFTDVREALAGLAKGC